MPESSPERVRLFVSHNSRDKYVVEPLVELLKYALRLPAASIRCTSLPGHKLPGGANASHQLREEVLSADAFVGVVSNQSLASLYVAFELGARWGAEKHLLPLLAPGCSFEHLREPLSALNALRCEDPGDVHQLVRDVAKVLSITAEPPAAYEGYVDRLTRLTAPLRVAEAAEIDDQLGEEEWQILTLLADATEDLSNIAIRLSMHPERAQYWLCELYNKQMVDAQHDGDRCAWCLAQKGRGALVRAHLL